jgi:DNA-binding MarR family transcriptional regulator
VSGYSAFFSEVVRLELGLWNRLDDLQEVSGAVSLAQLQALRAVRSRDGAARVQDVADALQITVGAASKLVDRLERDGLALRSANPADRRSMLVALTRDGEAAYEKASEAESKNLEDVLGAALTDDRAAEIADVLSGLSAALDS